ncbi:MAG TPA: S8 family serine peptidase [Anaerolineales bacterium]|nr:S8 family serine peptidase [Anaerolineales bacterium]
MSRKILFVFSLLIILTMVVAPVSARQPRADIGDFELEGVDPADVQLVDRPIAPVHGKNSDTGLFIVRLVDAPVASYTGAVPGFAATSPSATGQQRLDADSAAANAYRDYLLDKQQTLIAEMNQKLGRSVKVEFQFTNAVNGFAAAMSYAEAVEVSGLRGVLAIYADTMRHLETDVGPLLISADDIWNGNTYSGDGNMGEGVIIGVLDTGINYDHPSFADIGGDAYDHTNPYGAGNYVGYCDDTDPSLCNDKLIGAYDLYPGGSGGPGDTNGHGSHTAGTAGGNVHDAVFSFGSDTYTVTIQGVAPHANIIAFKICSPSCPGSSAIAAVDHAIADGVHVLNYSISGSDDPWNDPVDLAFLEAFNAGIFVSASAGNDGPGPSTVAKTGPWNASVAASTHNRVIAHTIDVVGGATGMAAFPGAGTDIFSNITGVITYDPANLNGCAAFPANFFDGDIALIQRGACTFATKVNNAAAAGAPAVVVFNNAGGPPIAMGGLDGTPPAVMLDLTDGNDLKDFIDANAPVTITINAETSYVQNDLWEDFIAGFSSRGPSQFSLLAPSYTAPGVNILAAYAADGGDTDTYGFLQGTSMSSPHGAGAAALMIALNPGWSPAEVKSAMSLTADPTPVMDSDGISPADPFDTGSGRLDLGAAGMVGFVLDETYANFVDANPADGGDPTTLNVPNFVNNDCFATCSWTRTIVSTLDVTVEWTANIDAPAGLDLTVTPSVFTLGPGDTQEIEVTADVSALDGNVWVFGDISFTPSIGGGGPTLSEPHFPVVVLPKTGVLPASVDITTRRNAGSVVLEDLQTFEITDLTIESFGLTQATITEEMLSVDPTNGDPYDNVNDGTVFYITVSVPTGAKRLIAHVFASEAPDIDLFLGTGSTPSAGTELCASTTASFIEYCELVDPAAGTYWVLVQNWQESGNPPDAVSLATAVVPGTDAGNMSFDGPSQVHPNVPFDLQLFWDTPTMMAGDRWYGAFSLGTHPSSPGNIGTIPVNIIRVDDDVTKTPSSSNVVVGETLTYTIQVENNVFWEDLTYAITDTIPAGLTYVPGSATASDGTVNVVGDTIYWDVTMPLPEFGYEVSDSISDSSCSSPFGAYVNLQDFGILAIPGLEGDTIGFTAFSTGNPIHYYGTNYTGMGFTDDGFAIADIGNNWAGAPWIPQSIPDPDFPNNVLAMMWHDFEIFYDAPSNAGVSLAVSGANIIIAEFDNVEFFGGSADNFDYQIVMTRAVNDAPGAYEIVFAYDNLNGDLSGLFTVGLENVLGTDAAAFLNNASATGVLSDGLMVCFDWVAFGVDPATLTYQVTVDEGAELGETFTNTVEHSVDNEGSKTETTSATVWFGTAYYLPVIFRE